MKEEDRIMKIFAHRGASGYAPENTLEAFQLAIDHRADGVELDVHLTRDKQLIVVHDERIERVSDGNGLVAMMSLKDIKKYLFNKTHPEYREARAPTLEEVFELLAPTEMKVNIELKNSRIPYEGIEELCMELVEKTGMGERVIYSSFNHHSMAYIKRLNPSAVCGLLYDCCLKDPAGYMKKVGADALHPHFSDVLLNPEEYAELIQAGGLVHVWTVNDDRDMRKVMDTGVHILITNYPDRAVAMREEYSSTI